MNQTSLIEPATALSEAGRDLLFRQARTANSFSSEPVSDETLRELYELVKWPPTEANTNPMRVLFVRSPKAKARLLPLMSEGNRAKTASAPVSAIVAADVDFHEHLDRLFPHVPNMKANFSDVSAREAWARFGAAMQAGYFILAVRSLGLAAGPMTGLDLAGVDTEFFAEKPYRTLMVVNIGHPGSDPWFDRLPRLDYEEMIEVI